MKIVQGDLLDATEDVLCQQTNCVGARPGGLEAAMVRRFGPSAASASGGPHLPGTIAVNGRVVNLYAQRQIGGPRGNETAAQREAWFRACLDQLAAIPRVVSAAFPYQIGCGLARGNWANYEKILSEWERSTGVEVVIYRLPA